MFQRGRAWVGLAIACPAAIGWAINLTFLQRLAEPAKPWGGGPDIYGEYAWARDPFDQGKRAG